VAGVGAGGCAAVAVGADVGAAVRERSSAPDTFPGVGLATGLSVSVDVTAGSGVGVASGSSVRLGVSVGL
jgi:hypothetical protein